MKDWIKLGGGNSGCCGNNVHTYGFHREASSVPVSDYSRRHEAPKPYNMSWACAGDFHHGYNTKLMAMQATVLKGLMAGKYPMICEFIGKPWANKPVYYWARWNGNGTLQRYTGKGHDHWSHISWWRSKANQRANLWVPSNGRSSGGIVVPENTEAPAYPGYPLKPNPAYDANVETWQRQAVARGAKLQIDGKYGAKTAAVVLGFQKANPSVGHADGVIGRKTWDGIWNKAFKLS